MYIDPMPTSCGVFLFCCFTQTTFLKTARATPDLSLDAVLKILSESPDTHMEEIYFGEKRKKSGGYGIRDHFNNINKLRGNLATIDIFPLTENWREGKGSGGHVLGL